MLPELLLPLLPPPGTPPLRLPVPGAGEQVWIDGPEALVDQGGRASPPLLLTNNLSFLIQTLLSRRTCFNRFHRSLWTERVAS